MCWYHKGSGWLSHMVGWSITSSIWNFGESACKQVPTIWRQRGQCTNFSWFSESIRTSQKPFLLFVESKKLYKCYNFFPFYRWECQVSAVGGWGPRHQGGPSRWIHSLTCLWKSGHLYHRGDPPCASCRQWTSAWVSDSKTFPSSLPAVHLCSPRFFPVASLSAPTFISPCQKTM